MVLDIAKLKLMMTSWRFLVLTAENNGMEKKKKTKSSCLME